jgi:hypothetical protein
LSGRPKKREKRFDAIRATPPDAEDQGPPAEAKKAIEPCSFCVERPFGALGHEGFRQQVYKIAITDRSYVRMSCIFCGSPWVRRRIDARTFEWLAFAV